MESNVVTLETAKKLKAAEFPQESYANWFYVDYGPTDDWELGINQKLAETINEDWVIAAPTAQEIADQLPNDYRGRMLVIEKNTEYKALYGQHESYPPLQAWGGSNMAEALASLWLKLNPNKEERGNE